MFLLDTSAILAHCFSEPGAEIVDRMLAERSAYVSAITWYELRMKLQDTADAQSVLLLYAATVAGTIDVSKEVAEAAYELRKQAGVRIPAMDSIIAGTARMKGYQLVHRDAHLAAIPTALLDQRRLPAKL